MRRRLKFSVVAVALSAAWLAGGCSGAQPPRLDGTDIAIDRNTGFVSRIYLTTRGSLADHDFAVKENSGTSSFWNAMPAARGGGPAVELTPTVSDNLPSIGSQISVAAIDRKTGSEQIVGQGVVANSGGELVNEDFRYWRANGTFPAGWQKIVDGNDGNISAVQAPGGSGVAVSLTTLATARWNVYELWQDIRPSALPLLVWIRTDRDCDANVANPHSVSGVTLRDPRGYEVTYCTSSAVTKPSIAQLADGRQTVIIIPGFNGRWNRVKLDPEAARAYARLIPDDKGLIRLIMRVAFQPTSQADSRRPVSVAFSGFRSTH